MIGYFFIVSRGEFGNEFSKYIRSFRNLFKDKINNTIYSKDVDLLLIEYKIEGEFITYPKKEFRFKSYRLKEKSAAVEVGVRKEFFDWSAGKKKEFIISSTITSIILAEKVFIKKGLDVTGIPDLLHDLQICIEAYRKIEIN